MQADRVRAVFLLCYAVLFMVLSAGVYASTYSQPSTAQFGISSSDRLFQNDLSASFGKSVSSSCTSFPCASGEMTGTGEYDFNFGLMPSAVSNPQPQVFYTDLLNLDVLGQPLNISSISATGVTASSPRDFGAITVYFCVDQTNDPLDNCPARIIINSTMVSTLSLNETISPQQGLTVEVSGFAGENASVGDIISFELAIV